MESNMRTVISMLVILAVGVSIAAAQQVKKESVPGINNFAKVESTVACAGAITPAAVADIKKMGYAAIINLREASEPGADDGALHFCEVVKTGYGLLLYL